MASAVLRGAAELFLKQATERRFRMRHLKPA